MKKMDLFIGSYVRDFRYLKYCLRSVNKFASGFNKLHLFVPEEDVVALYRDVDYCNIKRANWVLHPSEAWPGKGMLHHLYQVMNAEKLAPDADFILHTDSDCVFTGPVTPADFLVGDKPMLLYASYDFIGSNVRIWQERTQNALGWKPVNEFMRRHGIVHCPPVYAATRSAIEKNTRQPLAEYLRNGINEFPQSFCDFPVLGEIAWQQFRHLYHWINTETDPLPPYKIHQSWSHQDVTTEDLALYSKLGLLD